MMRQMLQSEGSGVQGGTGFGGPICLLSALGYRHVEAETLPRSTLSRA